MEARVSVRSIVEFILRSGDIDNRIGSTTEQAMQEGGRIHRMIQKRAGADYRAEVPLAFAFHGKDVDIRVEGRADGIIENDTGVTIDEIKATYADVMHFKEAKLLHLAQAKFYAYIYASQNGIETIKVRITYCNIDTEEMRFFNEDYSLEELEEFVNSVCSSYEKWAKMEIEWHDIRNKSIEGLPFPFPYRDGQEELVRHVYHTICHSKKLFLEAPTGVGKTISTVYPSICALGRDKAQKIFYLTAKTITRTVAHDSLEILRENGLKCKSIILTAKEKICMTGETKCNPDACPYAKGHFDRVNDAVYAMLTEKQAYTRDTVYEYAERFEVCPFEMALDVSLFCDCIIGDYNYAFDPRAKLKRFFGEGNVGAYIFLVDEAHNLVDRAREMYSAVLVKEKFLEIKKMTEILFPQVAKRAENCNKEMLKLKRLCRDSLIDPDVEPLTKAVQKLYSILEDTLHEKPGEKKKEKLPQGELRDVLTEFYFELFHFLDIYERVDENYTNYCTYGTGGDFFIKLFCVNPRANLHECMADARSSILFSATLLPIQYYKELLSGEDKDYEVYAKSVFNPDKRGLFIAQDVTSKYTRRNEEEFIAIATYIYEITANRHGNYMVFFPSYSFMEKVYSSYEKMFCNDEVEVITQTTGMKEEEKEGFLEKFREERTDSSLIGFCVMGGIFSEGIDLKNDALIGAIIVGTGIPQVCLEQDIIKSFFDSRGDTGFDYAYRFPGMNKVLQAAGRVIRTEEDIGVVALLDERFLQNSYKSLFPREWTNYGVASLKNISSSVEKFWNEWL